MKPIYVHLLRGQGGVYTSAGVDAMGKKIQAMAPSASVKTWNWGDWQNTLRDLRFHKGDAVRVVIGYSLGANAATWIEAAGPELQIDLLVALDPTVWSTMQPIHKNVKKVLLFKNDNPLNVVGLAGVTLTPGFDMSRMTVVHTLKPHLEEDWDPDITAQIVMAVRSTIMGGT